MIQIQIKRKGETLNVLILCVTVLYMFDVVIFHSQKIYWSSNRSIVNSRQVWFYTECLV
jgi:hypothetical protein